ncbi:MAG: GGDEF domain-containing protein [Candidatus Tectomicrobia bacterium]|uniref:diguanylate cyclase n=1 Tax=Tectimicrobiota bacterium TaxID=2528274 RepID=A0A932GPE0_UNCTE|nr:GGDEF domain-containing protein [Candidatus Tectomicrobia bacterium]
MTAHEIEERILQTQTLPVLPAEVKDLISISLEETTSAREIASMIMKSPALSARMLKIVNSPFYGFPRRITTVSQAVVILGLPATRNIALSLSVLDLFRGRKSLRKHMPAFLEHSLGAALAAQEMSKQLAYPLAEEAFMAGLLHDLGVLALMECIPDLYAGILAQVGSSAETLASIEEHTLGLTHARAGGLLCQAWGLPEALQTAISQHHDPPAAWSEADHQTHLNTLAFLGNLLSRVLSDSTPEAALGFLQKEVQRILNWNPKEIEEILTVLAMRIREAAPSFEIQVRSPSGLLETILAANRKLGEMTLAYSELIHSQKESIERLRCLEEQLEQVNRKLHEIAITDDLTKIHNHRYFQECLSRQLEKARRKGETFSLVLIDLDRFRKINEQHGHLYGDQVLREIAQVLKKTCRTEDTLARYGGEEFALLLPDTNAMGAVALVERLRREVSEFSRELLGFSSPLALSAGISQWTPESPETTGKELLRQADQALLGAKRKGENCSAFPESSSKPKPSPRRRIFRVLPISGSTGKG